MPYELRGSLRGYRISAHAARRIEQRGFNLEDLELIAENGEPFTAERGLLVIQIPDSPFAFFFDDGCRRRLAGGTMILDPWKQVVVTVYLNYGDERRPLMRSAV